MAEIYRWLPGKREDKLALANNWLEILALKATPWGIPAAEVTGPGSLTALTQEATTSLTVVKSSERTPVAVTKCRVDFKTLLAKMQYIKKLYFNSPPRTDEDLSALGLKPPDTTHTPKPTPTDLVAFLLSLIPTDHTVVAAFHIAGSKRRGKGPYHGAEIRIWVLPLGAPPPPTADAAGWRSEVCTASPWEHSFEADEIGCRLYIAMRWENPSVSKDRPPAKGPWSEIKTIIIP
jgi:hypothetical protein